MVDTALLARVAGRRFGKIQGWKSLGFYKKFLGFNALRPDIKL